MRYSRRFLILLLRLVRAKSLWGTAKAKIAGKRRQMERLGLLSLPACKNKIDLTSFEYEGYPYYELSPKEADYENFIFYTHGGAYVYEITRRHWDFLIDLCVASKSKIVVPLYPLAPEHTKDSTFPWLYALFQRVSAMELERGKSIVLMGDSAGGGLALALAMKARDEQQNGIQSTILISPWLDLCMDTQEMRDINKVDPLLDHFALLQCGKYYIGAGQDDWISSPLHGDFTALPRLAVFTGTRDVLNPMAQAFRNKCKQQALALNYYEYEGSLHVFPIFRTKDAWQARKEIVDLLAQLR